MTLSDLRKVAVRQNARIRFRLSNGMECIVNGHGIAQVPELRGIPGFNLEDELAAAQEFHLEMPAAGGKGTDKSRKYSRAEFAAMTAGGPRTAAAHEEHED